MVTHTITITFLISNKYTNYHNAYSVYLYPKYF